MAAIFFRERRLLNVSDIDLDALFRKKQQGYVSAYRKRRSDQWRAEGRCSNCGAVLPDKEPQYKTCEVCRQKAREVTRRFRARAAAEGRSLYTDETRARARLYSARIRAECKQKGLCTRCYHAPARDGMATCEVCAAKQLEYQRGYFAKMKARGY